MYYLFHKYNTAKFTAIAGQETRHTIGTRYGGLISETNINYDLEGAYQFGRISGKDISAFMLTSLIGYSFKNIKMSPNVFINADYASGSSPSNNKLKTFHSLFPLGHAYFGYIDVVGRQNIVHLQGGASLKPHPKGKFGIHYHSFSRANTNDSLYNAGGGIVRNGSTTSSSAKYIGSEIDVFYKQGVGKHLKLATGINHFIAGKFVKEAKPSAKSNITFFFVQAQYII